MKKNRMIFRLLFILTLQLVNSCTKKNNASVTPAGVSNTMPKLKGVWTCGEHINNATSIVVSGNNFFVGSYDSVYISTDTCKSWRVINPSNPLITQCFLIYGSDILIGGYHNGVDSYDTAKLYRCDNLGNNWKSINLNPIVNGSLTSLGSINNYIFATSNGVYEAIYNSWSWTSINNGLAGTTSLLTVVDSNLFVCGSTIYTSNNKGVSWTPVNIALPPNVNSSNFYFRVLTSRGNDIYAGSTEGLYNSHDKGISWLKVGVLDNDDISDIAVEGTNVFVLTYTEGYYFSKDSGNSWAKIDGLPSGTSFNKCLIKDNVIYATGGNYSSPSCTECSKTLNYGAVWQCSISSLQ